MRDSQIKLSQIVSQKQIFQKKKGQQHAVYNSLKRNTIYGKSSQQQQPSYQCKLPQVKFNRKDLSIVLRYLLYKQQMKISDRNLLRRILLTNFQQQLIIAGSKKFVQFLKLVEGQNALNHQLIKGNYFFFILKGKALVTTCGFSYQVYSGNTFGQKQILSRQTFQSVVFQSKFILLALSIDHFNLYFRKYYQNKYDQKLKEVSCIEAQFLNKVPLINKYMFFDKINHKTFKSGEKIVSEGDKLQNIYFLGQKGKEQDHFNILYNSPGLNELLKGSKTYFQTIYCLNRLIIAPYVNKNIFQYYILNPLFVYMIPPDIQSFRNSNKKLYLQAIEQKEKLSHFMKIKKVKLLSTKQRLKTEYKNEIENSFIFFKQGIIKGLPIRQRYKSLKTQQSVKTPRITNFSEMIKKTIQQFSSLKKIEMK